jgi:phosphoribosylformimino-5-aminoimidazole carboxamide ribotide isomerase
VLKRYHAEPGDASGFAVLPAIDLRGGRVVRLEQGDFARETSFSDDPVAVARGFAETGARWLHVVDLDGAQTGEPAHAAVIGEIVAAVGGTVSVEVAGGLRSRAAVDTVLASGAARAVIGTAALRDPRFAAALVVAYGSTAIAVAIDVRDGRAVGHGWASADAGVDALDAIRDLAAVGVTIFEVTAIDQDGLLGGPDLALYRRVLDRAVGEIIASAGVTSVDDLRALRSMGCAGAIVGRALYDGRLSLADALGA